MHSIGAGDLAGRKQPGNIQIAFSGGWGAYAYTLVSEAHVHSVGVCCGVHGDSRNAELLACALDAQCNFTPVGDQDLVKHVLLVSLIRGWWGSIR
jgi:hypothetical protein